NVGLAVKMGGPKGATDYDVLDVRGPVNLNGAALTLTLDIEPPIASTYTLLTNDGTDAISGTFAGLPEGARFGVTGHAFVITYRGGDGNDVTLVAVPVPCELDPTCAAG